MKYEAQRQHGRRFLRDGRRLAPGEKETAGWDEARGVTVVQRRKEEAADYRYFPEPDLTPVVVDEAWREQRAIRMGELPAAQRVRLSRDYGLSAYDVGVLTRQGRATVAYFEDAARRTGDAKAASNWVTNRVLATLKERKQEIRDFPLTADRLAGLIAEQKASGLSKQAAEEVYNRMLESGGSAPDAIAQLGIQSVDEGALRDAVRRAVAANPAAVARIQEGQDDGGQLVHRGGHARNEGRRQRRRRPADDSGGAAKGVARPSPSGAVRADARRQSFGKRGGTAGAGRGRAASGRRRAAATPGLPRTGPWQG